jgi:hypothetical protein
MVETKAKAIVVCESLPKHLAVEVKENGKDQGKGYSRERFHFYQALEGKENGRDQGKGYTVTRLDVNFRCTDRMS